jgi:hypothetical protein
MTLDFYGRLLREFGAATGIGRLSFNDDGVCVFVVDGGVHCALAYIANDDSLTMLCELPCDDVPLANDLCLSRIVETSLNSLAGDAPSVGRDPISGRWIAYRRLARHALNVEMLSEALSEFVLWALQKLNAPVDAQQDIDRADRRIVGENITRVV